MNPIECHKRPDGIWVITLCFLDNHNPYFTHTLLNEFISHLDKFRTDKTSQGLMVIWKADATFQGIDPVLITHLIDDTNGDRPDRRCDTIILPFHHLQKALRLVETHSKPVVFVAHGLCWDIGFELSLACHHRILTHDTRMGFFSQQVVMPPCVGGSVRLPRLIGLERALSVFLDTGLMTPEQIRLQGLLCDTADDEQSAFDQGTQWILGQLSPETCQALQPWSETMDISHQTLSSVLTHSKIHLQRTHRQGHPAYETLFCMLFDGLKVCAETAFEIEKSHLASFFMNPLTFGFIRTEKLSLPALKKGANRPKTIPEQTLEKVTIIGAGERGLTFAKKSFETGLNVVVLEKDAETAEKTAQLLYAQLNLSPKHYRRLTVTADITQASGSHLVLDCLPEDIALKQAVLPEIEKVVSSRCIIAIISQYLRTKFIKSALSRPQNSVVLLYTGLYGFNPIVEILKTTRMNDRCIPLVLDYTTQIGLIPLVIKDSPLGYIRRSQIDYFNEVITLLHEGIHPEIIDRIALKMGLSESPFITMDKIGLQNLHHFITFHQETDQDNGDVYHCTTLEQVLKVLVHENRAGLKYKAGFYDYDEHGQPTGFWKHYDKFKLTLFGSADKKPSDPEAISDRFKLIFMRNAIHFIEQGYIQDVREIDVACVYGCGFMRYSGGCLSYLDAMGIKSFQKTITSLEDKMPDPSRFRTSPLTREMAKMGNTFYKRFIPHLVHLKPRLIQTCGDDLEKASMGLVDA